MSRRATILAATVLPVAAAVFAAVLAARGHLPEHLSSIMAELCGDEAPFVAENRAAMQRMMKAMTIEPSGDVDRDFAAMMIAHHQGAIEMAEAELRHGRNELLRRIAQGIVVEQRQEIAAIRLARGEGPARSVASLDQSRQPSTPAEALRRPTAFAPITPHR